MKILIIRLSSIGDIVLTEPIVRQIRRTYPDAIIDFLTKPAYVELVGLIEGIHTIQVWDKPIATLQKLRKERYSLIIDLHNKLVPIIIKIALFPTKAVTYDKKRSLRLAIVKHRTQESIDTTVKLYASIMETLKIAFVLEDPKLTVTVDENKPLTELISRLQKEKKLIIGIFPGATHETKQFPIEQWETLIGVCKEEFPEWQFVVMGSKKESILADRLILINKEIISLCGVCSLKETSEIISLVDIVISNDSGPMHIAAALNKPQIALFGATHTRLGFRPLNKKAKIIQKNIECQPCGLHGGAVCELGHFRCMVSIKSKEIITEIQSLSKEYCQKDEIKK